MWELAHLQREGVLLVLLFCMLAWTNCCTIFSRAPWCLVCTEHMFTGIEVVLVSQACEFKFVHWTCLVWAPEAPPDKSSSGDVLRDTEHLYSPKVSNVHIIISKRSHINARKQGRIMDLIWSWVITFIKIHYYFPNSSLLNLRVSCSKFKEQFASKPRAILNSPHVKWYSWLNMWI